MQRQSSADELAVLGEFPLCASSSVATALAQCGWSSVSGLASVSLLWSGQRVGRTALPISLGDSHGRLPDRIDATWS